MKGINFSRAGMRSSSNSSTCSGIPQYVSFLSRVVLFCVEWVALGKHKTVLNMFTVINSYTTKSIGLPVWIKYPCWIYIRKSPKRWTFELRIWISLGLQIMYYPGSERHNWLLEIDNIDDINVLCTSIHNDPNVVSKLIPQTGLQQHMLITSRNPHGSSIPALSKLRFPVGQGCVGALGAMIMIMLWGYAVAIINLCCAWKGIQVGS